MADSLNPFDDEAFRDISSAAAEGDDDLPATAEESLAGRQQGKSQPAMIGRNGRHPFSGPLAPLGVGASQAGAAGAQGKRRRLLPLMLGLVGVVVILSCLGVGAAITINLLSIQSSLNSPQTTLDNFYSALHTRDYQTAYNQLSSSYQSRITEDSFRATFELIGTIESYQITNLQTQGDQATATVRVTLVKPDGGTVNETKTVQLLQENGNWKISRVDPSLTRAIWPIGQQG
jgi:hypothetical protein